MGVGDEQLKQQRLVAKTILTLRLMVIKMLARKQWSRLKEQPKGLRDQRLVTAPEEPKMSSLTQNLPHWLSCRDAGESSTGLKPILKASLLAYLGDDMLMAHAAYRTPLKPSDVHT